MAPKKPAAATTLRQLHGVASSKATFIRSDARALVAPAASRSQLKGALVSPFEPCWPLLSADDEARVMVCAHPRDERE